MGHRTPLYDEHVALDARLADFAGWDMPIDYGSQIAEHRAVRENAGMFDVSHMAVVDISGSAALDFLRYLLANDIAKADADGTALYSCMLDTHGGVIDDLIIFHIADDYYRVVVNAVSTDKDLAWIEWQARDYRVDIRHLTERAIIAVQGPRARGLAAEVLETGLADQMLQLKPFTASVEGDTFVSRTGFTGEDGCEIMLPAADAPVLWRALRNVGVTPAGLGARDTLRLEAGLNLYGQDMDEAHTPLESGLAWTVAFEPIERGFLGRKALEHARDTGVERKLVGLILAGRGVMRHGTPVRAADSGDEPDTAAGVVTSGSYAPTLSCSIALARIPANWQQAVEVLIRDDWRPARIVAPPFVRHGKSVIGC